MTTLNEYCHTFYLAVEAINAITVANSYQHYSSTYNTQLSLRLLTLSLLVGLFKNPSHFMFLCDTVNELVLSVPLETKHNAQPTNKTKHPLNWQELDERNFISLNERKSTAINPRCHLSNYE